MATSRTSASSYSGAAEPPSAARSAPLTTGKRSCGRARALRVSPATDSTHSRHAQTVSRLEFGRSGSHFRSHSPRGRTPAVLDRSTWRYEMGKDTERPEPVIGRPKEDAPWAYGQVLRIMRKLNEDERKRLVAAINALFGGE